MNAYVQSNICRNMPGIWQFNKSFRYLACDSQMTFRLSHDDFVLLYGEKNLYEDLMSW